MSRVPRRRGLALVAAVSLLATAACGSTVQSSGGSAPTAGGVGGGAGPTNGDGLGGTELGDADSAGFVGLGGEGSSAPGGLAVGGDTAAAPGDGAAGAPIGGAGSIGGAPAAGGSPGAASAPRVVGRQGPGVTAKEIFIGVVYAENADAATAAVGAGAVTRGDEKANSQAVIDEINARGGVAGRRLVPVFHAYDAQSAEPKASQDQAACATFTEDNKVFATTASGISDTFPACMKKAGVLQITSGSIIGPDREYFTTFPTYFHTGLLTQDRMMADLVPALRRQGYLTGWNADLGRPGPAKAKIGVLSIDKPTWSRPLDRVFLPALAKAGHPVDPSLVYRVYSPPSQSEIGRAVADVQNATLRFREAGVTHVVMFDGNGSLLLVFAQNARNQRYFPRLGFNSGAGAQALYDAGVVDKEQLSGGVGLGWLPIIDLPAGKGDAFLTSATKECLEIIKRRTGQTFTSTNAANLALVACDTLFTIAATIRKAGEVINLNSGRAGLESVGGSLRVALVPKVFFSPRRHDGLEIGFDMVWDDGCGCIQYRDKGHRIP